MSCQKVFSCYVSSFFAFCLKSTAENTHVLVFPLLYLERECFYLFVLGLLLRRISFSFFWPWHQTKYHPTIIFPYFLLFDFDNSICNLLSKIKKLNLYGTVFLSRFLFCRTEGRWFWVGFNKRDPEHPGMWKWSDGSYVSLMRRWVNRRKVPTTCAVMFAAWWQVMTPFVDKNDEDDRRNCAVFSDLSDVLVPQPCDAKHEWICKLDRGVTSSHGCSLLTLPVKNNCFYRRCILVALNIWPGHVE